MQRLERGRDIYTLTAICMVCAGNKGAVKYDDSLDVL